jgi:predicted DNA-binding protein YlxM (UPF0122 family)
VIGTIPYDRVPRADALNYANILIKQKKITRIERTRVQMYISGSTMEEIAYYSGVSRGAVKTSIYSVIKKGKRYKSILNLKGENENESKI